MTLPRPAPFDSPVVSGSLARVQKHGLILAAAARLLSLKQGKMKKTNARSFPAPRRYSELKKLESRKIQAFRIKHVPEDGHDF
jgi:hypothetical protein